MFAAVIRALKAIVLGAQEEDKDDKSEDGRETTMDQGLGGDMVLGSAWNRAILVKC